MKSFSIFLAGILFTLCLALLQTCIKQSIFHRDQVTYLSSEIVRENIKAQGITLPKNAYALEYNYRLSRDNYYCHISFSATNEEIELVIERMLKGKSKAANNHHRIPEEPDYIWRDGSGPINWWPKSAEGMKVYEGTYYWIAHDLANQRCFYYNSSSARSN
ncbi:MAG: hypothetical protein ACSHX4_07615 [Opitutaceae bacterium]